MSWHDKKILVLGAGDTGVSVVRYLTRLGARVRIGDSRNDPPGLARLRDSGCDVVTGSFTASLFSDAELIVASPGVAVAGPACDPALARALAQGKKVVGDIELFAWQQNEVNQNETSKQRKRSKVIGLTGSNGKSTVTAMAGAMCAAAGLKTVLAGNIGLPVLDALQEEHEHGVPDVYVLELSSFQLETTSTLQLESAAMLNLSQDHLDRYAGMRDYAAAKARIFAYAKHQVLNRDDAASMAMRRADLTCSTFGLNEAIAAEDIGIHNENIVAGLETLLSLNDMPITGLHNAANAMAAFALCLPICRSLGLKSEQLAEGLRSFKGLPHRLQDVGTINGVTFYDDSKGTNVGSTVAALNGMTVPVVLIAGGEGKEQDFAPLAEPIRKRAKSVVLIGKDARLIDSAITSARVTTELAVSMADAVKLAYLRASSGDAVLLSPACASFDMFKNYKHRGEVFAQCVAELKIKVEGEHAL